MLIANWATCIWLQPICYTIIMKYMIACKYPTLALIFNLIKAYDTLLCQILPIFHLYEHFLYQMITLNRKVLIYTKISPFHVSFIYTLNFIIQMWSCKCYFIIRLIYKRCIRDWIHRVNNLNTFTIHLSPSVKPLVVIYPLAYLLHKNDYDDK